MAAETYFTIIHFMNNVSQIETTNIDFITQKETANIILFHQMRLPILIFLSNRCLNNVLQNEIAKTCCTTKHFS